MDLIEYLIKLKEDEPETAKFFKNVKISKQVQISILRVLKNITFLGTGAVVQGGGHLPCMWLT